ncbi:MAG: aminotransferase class I/II-fold pyridoxal phosphate-dependent enzyme, partial [Pseudomonadales bacterium]|nr:aminotransferase class I/II-fold pyridoxal phosphate-dependent enzyme [Pseudomonadales bacterium]
MNRFLTTLKPYPFERLNRLLTDVVPADKPPVPLSLGEPKHPAPDFLIDMLADDAFLRIGVGTYPPTKGLPELRQAISSFASRRYGLAHAPDPDTQVLPVNGTREALFAFAQVVIDNTSPSLTLIPNPFYQIYEGAVLLAGSEPRFVNCTEATGHCPSLSDIDSDTWRQCQLIYICNPGNPSRA